MRKNQLRSSLSLFLMLVSLLGVSCQQRKADIPYETEAAETGLTLDNASLEQADEDGQTQWKVQAKRVFYSDDRKRADLEEITGNLYSNGEVVLQVSAKTGEVLEDGEKILLKGDVRGIDPRNKAVLEGQHLEWFPEEDRVLLQEKVKGTNPDLRFTANQGEYFTTEERVEVSGSVIATSQDPSLQMKAEQLIWEIPQEIVRSNQALEINRYDGEKITDRVVANQGEINLESELVTLNGKIQLNSADPRLQITTETALWNIAAETVTLNKPVEIIHGEENIVARGNGGRADLKNEVVRLEGQVRAINQNTSSQIAADQITWDISTQGVQAMGNVIYQQQSNPPLTLRGTKATGNIASERVEVTGGNGSGQVVTEIIPNDS